MNWNHIFWTVIGLAALGIVSFLLIKGRLPWDKDKKP